LFLGTAHSSYPVKTLSPRWPRKSERGTQRAISFRWFACCYFGCSGVSCGIGPLEVGAQVWLNLSNVETQTTSPTVAPTSDCSGKWRALPAQRHQACRWHLSDARRRREHMMARTKLALVSLVEAGAEAPRTAGSRELGGERVGHLEEIATSNAMCASVRPAA